MAFAVRTGRQDLESIRRLLLAHLTEQTAEGGEQALLVPGVSRFVGSGLVVEVERESEVERVDEVTSWQATLRVLSGKTGFTSYHHRWTCGA